MKIAIAGGTTEADFLISSLKKAHTVKVINQDKTYAQYIADTHGIPVTCGDPCKEYILDTAGIQHYDILIVLTPDDADNLAICQLAKEKCHIAKTIALAANPRNVALFKKLGINEVISPAYVVLQQIEQDSPV